MRTNCGHNTDKVRLRLQFLHLLLLLRRRLLRVLRVLLLLLLLRRRRRRVGLLRLLGGLLPERLVVLRVHLLHLHLLRLLPLERRLQRKTYYTGVCVRAMAVQSLCLSVCLSLSLSLPLSLSLSLARTLARSPVGC